MENTLMRKKKHIDESHTSIIRLEKEIFNQFLAQFDDANSIASEND